MGKSIAIVGMQDRPAGDVAWKIPPAQSMVYINVDDLVISGRGPPRAGPQYVSIPAPCLNRSCVPCPATESQVVPILQSHHPNRIAGSPHEWLTEPSIAVRHEGAAACIDLPSNGDPS